MDIKSRNIKYSLGMKAFAVIVAWLCFLGALGSGIYLIYNSSYTGSSSYYDSSVFRREFAGLSRDTVELYVKLKSEESIKASNDNSEAIADGLYRMQFIKDKLSSVVNYVYYVRNTQTGEAFTNVKREDPLTFVKNQAHAVNLNRWDNEYYDPGLELTKSMLTGTGFEAYAAVTEPLKQGDTFYDDFIEYSRMKAIMNNMTILLALSLLLMVISAAYLICVAGKKEKGGEIVLTFVDGIYADIHMVLVLFAAYISLLFAANNFRPSSIAFWAILMIIASLDAFIGISYVLSMVRQIKCRRLFKNTLIYMIAKALMKLTRMCFGGRLFKPWLLLLLLGYGIINGLFFAVGIHIYIDSQFLIVFGLFLMFNIAALYFGAKSLSSLTQIMEGVREISEGNMDYNLDIPEISVAFSGFAGNIQSLQNGLKKAVAEAVKGERMKTDLITNVSHDLKTPLTSIINYVDLLKKESLDNSKANEYIEVLEEKSARLKQLIEDLIEASKASSGNLAVSAGQVDLHELVMQACGEYEEKISKAALDIRVSSEEKKVLVFADGRHMWRIVENLLSNTVKYSMPNSRVYVNITQNEKCGIFTIKNISAFPLNISPEQLTERFVRGDASRTTEGSGLGLSIAKSLTELQNGRFRIDIDGDLFKVTVEMPLLA